MPRAVDDGESCRLGGGGKEELLERVRRFNSVTFPYDQCGRKVDRAGPEVSRDPAQGPFPTS